MILKIATCLLALSVFTACETTTSTAGRQSMEQRLLARNSANPYSADEPMPPAEGPEDVADAGSLDPDRNPGLLPTPLLRENAAAGL